MGGSTKRFRHVYMYRSETDHRWVIKSHCLGEDLTWMSVGVRTDAERYAKLFDRHIDTLLKAQAREMGMPVQESML